MRPAQDKNKTKWNKGLKKPTDNDLRAKISLFSLIILHEVFKKDKNKH